MLPDSLCSALHHLILKPFFKKESEYRFLGHITVYFRKYLLHFCVSDDFIGKARTVKCIDLCDPVLHIPITKSRRENGEVASL